jgi:hypothetical protein
MIKVLTFHLYKLNGTTFLPSHHFKNLQILQVFLTTFQLEAMKKATTVCQINAGKRNKYAAFLWYLKLSQWSRFKSRSSGLWRHGGSTDLWNKGILPQHYMASQPRRTQLEKLVFLVPDMNITFQMMCLFQNNAGHDRKLFQAAPPSKWWTEQTWTRWLKSWPFAECLTSSGSNMWGESNWLWSGSQWSLDYL